MQDIDAKKNKKKKRAGNSLSWALLCLVESSNSIAEVGLQRHTLRDADPRVAVTAIPPLYAWHALTYAAYSKHTHFPEERRHCATELKVAFSSAVRESIKPPTPPCFSLRPWRLPLADTGAMFCSPVFNAPWVLWGLTEVDATWGRWRSVPLPGCNDSISWFKKLLQLK